MQPLQCIGLAPGISRYGALAPAHPPFEQACKALGEQATGQMAFQALEYETCQSLLTKRQHSTCRDAAHSHRGAVSTPD
jgi:hypothetical protein